MPQAVMNKENQRRAEKDLLIATKAFTVESKAKSWSYTASTFAVLAAVTAGAAFAPWWPLRLAFAVVEGLTIVRAFCLFHDFYHGAILRQSKLADVIYSVFGFTILSPASVWKETHNYHHAHTAKMVGSHIGSYPVVTTSMWKAMTPGQRLGYRLVRSPMNMFLAIFTVFFLGMCVRPFLRAPGKHWQGLVSVMVVAALTAAAFASGHGDMWLFAWFVPTWLATMSGSYLFYAQHNFPEAYIADRQTWTFSGAALDSSSYFRMNPVMHWFTANIGYHHVHHLNAAIPFYRLPETMAAVPELQNPGEVSWAPSQVLANFRLKLWDAEKSHMVEQYPA
jgi:omega-6 fatty acid desaturase (delta-12 desaturase)